MLRRSVVARGGQIRCEISAVVDDDFLRDTRCKFSHVYAQSSSKIQAFRPSMHTKLNVIPLKSLTKSRYGRNPVATNGQVGFARSCTL